LQHTHPRARAYALQRRSSSSSIFCIIVQNFDPLAAGFVVRARMLMHRAFVIMFASVTRHTGPPFAFSLLYKNLFRKLGDKYRAHTQPILYDPLHAWKFSQIAHVIPYLLSRFLFAPG
jgi:hypothetical protein